VQRVPAHVQLEERAALGLPSRGADRRIVGQELVRVVVIIAIVRAALVVVVVIVVSRIGMFYSIILGRDSLDLGAALFGSRFAVFNAETRHLFLRCVQLESFFSSFFVQTVLTRILHVS